jgi:hypothetical protein
VSITASINTQQTNYTENARVEYSLNFLGVSNFWKSNVHDRAINFEGKPTELLTCSTLSLDFNNQRFTFTKAAVQQTTIVVMPEMFRDASGRN